MTEADAIARSTRPATVSSLVDDLRRLGVEPGMTMMVHSSLAGLGFVAGGAQAVVAALLESVGVSGTVMMPTHSGHLSEPSAWEHPPIPVEWCDEVRSSMPAYDPVVTPTRSMGAIVECFRHVSGVVRSAHPTVSAAAVGPNAAVLIDGHELDHGLGEGSPQARLYELDGHVALLGVTHANNSSLHLSEYRAAPPDAPMATDGSPVIVDGRRQWATYANLVDDDSDFAEIGEAFAATGAQRSASIGAGTGRLMRSRAIVDFATGWMREHRHGATPG
jgi:aminoglycoside 3-N-acetyltransferase